MTEDPVPARRTIISSIGKYAETRRPINDGPLKVLEYFRSLLVNFRGMSCRREASRAGGQRSYREDPSPQLHAESIIDRRASVEISHLQKLPDIGCVHHLEILELVILVQGALPSGGETFPVWQIPPSGSLEGSRLRTSILFGNANTTARILGED